MKDIIPLVFDEVQRSRSDADKDAHIKNAYITKEGEAIIVNKRPALDYFGTSLNTYMAQGIYTTKNDNNTQTLFLYWDGTDWDLYAMDGDGSTSKLDDVPAFSGDDSDFIVNWAEAGFDGTYYQIAFSMGSTAFVWDFSSSTTTEISDANFTGAAAGLVWLDGYLFACQGREIENSNLNDAFTWNAIDFIVPQTMSSTGVNKIALHHNHIAALGANSIEFFRNAGYPTGSPLAVRKDIVITDVGMYKRQAVTGDSLATGQQSFVDLDGGNTGAFVSYSKAGYLGVHLLKDFKAIKISNTKIDRYLNYEDIEAQPRYPSISSVNVNGKILVILTIRDYIGSTENAISFAYDMETGLWSEWDVDSNIHSSGAFNIVSSAPLNYSGSSESKIPLGTVVQFVDGKLYFLDDDLYQDEDSSATARDITVEIQTPRYVGVDYRGSPAFGLRKFLRELKIICDRPSSSTNVAISWSDDDYQNFSSAVNLDISDPASRITGLGSFYERAFKLTHTANSSFRARSLVGYMDTGDQ